MLAFEWPGGVMSVPVTFRGQEVFAGWVPSSPWGSTPFLHEPVVELRNAANVVIAEAVVSGGTMDWYWGATRSSTVTFNVPAGQYSLTSREGQRLIRISGEGYSGFRLTATSVPPPITYHQLTVVAGSGGAVSGSGTYASGTVVNIVASAGATHDFAGWSGDAGGTANPHAVVVDRDKVIYANFVWRELALTTSATSGGVVTPGGSYPFGSMVSVTASPDSTHRFIGWTGDVTGTNPNVAVLLDRAKSVHAVFDVKASQVIDFAPMPDRPAIADAFALQANASSGLPVSFTVLSGPATLEGAMLHVSAPGVITVRASQAGDAMFLPAAPVDRTVNFVAAAAMRYQTSGRTLLHETGQPSLPFVLERK